MIGVLFPSWSFAKVFQPLAGNIGSHYVVWTTKFSETQVHTLGFPWTRCEWYTNTSDTSSRGEIHENPIATEVRFNLLWWQQNRVKTDFVSPSPVPYVTGFRTLIMHVQIYASLIWVTRANLLRDRVAGESDPNNAILSKTSVCHLTVSWTWRRYYQVKIYVPVGQIEVERR